MGNYFDQYLSGAQADQEVRYPQQSFSSLFSPSSALTKLSYDYTEMSEKDGYC